MEIGVVRITESPDHRGGRIRGEGKIRKNRHLELNYNTLRPKYCTKQYTIIFRHGATAPSAPGTPHDRGFTITLSATSNTR